ncbi:MAG: UPF0104 family protein, partial [Zetaproteobacteria bacterium]
MRGMEARSRKRLFAVRALVSAALLAALAAMLDWRAIAARLAEADLRWVAAAVALVAAGYVLCGLRWAWLARGLGLEVDARRKVRLFFVGMFASLFLPSTVGGDVLRGLLFARGRENKAAALASVVLDRANGLAALVGWVGLALLASEWWAAWGGALLVLSAAVG